MLELVRQKDNPDMERSRSVGNWDRMGGSRHVGVYQNKNTGEIHQAISGSRTFVAGFLE
jgi:hypothetical protein